MSDLLKRLRAPICREWDGHPKYDQLRLMAADEIERLLKKVKELAREREFNMLEMEIDP